MLNDKSLFTGKLMKTTNIIIIYVRGEDFQPTHIGIVTVSIKDEKDSSHWTELTNVLYISHFTGQHPKHDKFKCSLWQCGVQRG